MRKLLRKKKQGGFIISLEAIFCCTCLMCCLVIGWGSIGSKALAEVSDIGSAIGSLDQSYSMSGMAVYHVNDPVHNANNPIASWAGSSFSDNTDFCDEGCDCGVVMCIAATGAEAHAQ